MRALQIEFIKLFRLSTYIILGLFLLSFIVKALIVLQLGAMVDIDMAMKSLDASQIDGIYILFSIFLIINIGKEYSENTLRRSIIEGYTRIQFFAGKLLLVLVASIFLLVLQKLVFLISGAAQGHFKEAVNCLTFTTIWIALFKILFSGIFALFLVFVSRSIAFSIVLAIFWSVGEKALRVYLKFKYPESDYGAYFPATSIDQVLGQDGGVAYNFVAIAAAYMSAMIAASYGLLAYRDIK